MSGDKQGNCLHILLCYKKTIHQVPESGIDWLLYSEDQVGRQKVNQNEELCSKFDVINHC